MKTVWSRGSNRSQDLVRYCIRSALLRRNVQFRQGVICLPAVMQRFRLLFAGELGTRAVNFYTAGDRRKRDFQPYRQPRTFGNCAILRIEKSTASESDDVFFIIGG